MKQLAKRCSPSKELFLSQLLFFKKQCEQHHASLEFIHKYLIKISVDDNVFYIKFNLIDNEFFLFSKDLKNHDSILSFPSFYQLKKWFEHYYF